VILFVDDLFGDFICILLGIILFIIGIRSLIVFTQLGVTLGFIFLIASLVLLYEADVLKIFLGDG
jgi:hypothetical protein